MSQLTASQVAAERGVRSRNHWSHWIWIASWVVAALLVLPGLRVGPVFDDWFHAFDTHSSTGAWQRWFGLYDFFHADQVAQAREYGILPWWTDDRLSIEAAAKRRLAALCVGALVALLPVTSGIPGGRLILLPSVIACALFGMAGRRAVHAWREHKRQALLLGAWVALFGVGLHPLFRALVPADMARVAKELPAAAHAIAERCKGRAALGIGVPDPNAAYLSAILISMPESERPQALHLISMAPGHHHLEQTAPGRYELTVDGEFLALPWARIYRDTPVAAPLERDLRGVRVELLEASAESTRLALNVPADAPACWLTLEKGELVSIEPRRGLEWVPTGRPQ